MASTISLFLWPVPFDETNFFMPFPGCFYSVYGLQVCSDQPLLEFEPLVAATRTDVRICRQKIAFSPAYTTTDWHFVVTPDKATLCFQGVGVFHIPDFGTILFEPEPEADERMVARYLSGVVFAVLLHLRGLVVFHAASVAVNEQEAIAFIGESGAGKSTLAALLHFRGYFCIADDVTAIRTDSQHAAMIPGIPRLKIDPDLAQRYTLPADQLCSVHPAEEQIYYSLMQGFPQTPLNVRALVFLGIGSQPSLQRITARQAMIETVRYTLPTRFLQTNGSREHFQRCASIAGSVPAFVLTRTRNFDDREILADLVVNELLPCACPL